MDLLRRCVSILIDVTLQREQSRMQRKTLSLAGTDESTDPRCILAKMSVVVPTDPWG